MRLWSPCSTASRRRAVITTGAFGGDPPATGAIPINMQPASFDLLGPLPTGTTVLEASAGTGKTHAIGALVVRYVAEGTSSLEQGLVVMFGRAASQELRERVRTELVDAERALADPAPPARYEGPVTAARHLERRRGRAATQADPTALAEYDAATIATIHQFCHQVLTGLGVAGDSTPDAELVEGLDDLVVEVVDDLYVRGFARPDSRPDLQPGPGGRPGPGGHEEPARPSWSPRPRPQNAATRPPPGRLPPQACAPRSTAASAPATCSATTISSAGSPTRSCPRTRPRAPGCARAGMSCWSTSSRTPIRSSGRSWSGRSRGTRRSSWSATPSSRCTRSGAATSPHTWRRAPRLGSCCMLDHNWRSDGPVVRALQVLLDGVALGDPGIPVRPVTPGIPVRPGSSVRLERRAGPAASGVAQGPRSRPDGRHPDRQGQGLRCPRPGRRRRRAPRVGAVALAAARAPPDSGTGG